MCLPLGPLIVPGVRRHRPRPHASPSPSCVHMCARLFCFWGCGSRGRLSVTERPPWQWGMGGCNRQFPRDEVRVDRCCMPTLLHPRLQRMCSTLVSDTSTSARRGTLNGHSMRVREVQLRWQHCVGGGTRGRLFFCRLKKDWIWSRKFCVHRCPTNRYICGTVPIKFRAALLANLRGISDPEIDAAESPTPPPPPVY